MQIGVTNLSGVYTYHDDLARDGVNQQEYALTPEQRGSGHVSASCSRAPSDGAVYTPSRCGSRRSGRMAAHTTSCTSPRQHDSLYAFDADASPCAALWQVSLIDASHGGTGARRLCRRARAVIWSGKGYGDITPETGVTGTPVIDPGDEHAVRGIGVDECRRARRSTSVCMPSTSQRAPRSPGRRS